MTELVVCERCDDLWLREVQEEFRNGSLSEDTVRFLHGEPTSVPGRWRGGAVACGNVACKHLKQATTHKERKLVMKTECEVCKQERKSNNLVLNRYGDSRIGSDEFLQAPAVFANNDMKYEVNNLRARLCARSRDSSITYVPAKDVPSTEALRERPDLPQGKLQWLQRHDRESGDLYGVVPLCVGMPVSCTDHVGRSPDKQLLRGHVGIVHSWVEQSGPEAELKNGVRILKRLPNVVFVKFLDKDCKELPWKLPGCK